MKNEDGKLILSKAHFGNKIRNCHSVEEFKEAFNSQTYYSIDNRESTLRQRLKIAEEEYKLTYNVQKDVEHKGLRAKKILDYIQSELDKIDSKKQADKTWDEKNRERRNYMTKRSTSRGFIRNHATQEDLLELKKLIEENLK